MENPKSQTAEFRCGLQGIISKQSGDLLSSGQYRNLLNVSSTQEGSACSRLGIKKVGQITSGLNTCYFVRKLAVQGGEDPQVPSTNPRYLGVLTGGGARNIYRTLDYNTTTEVVAGADSTTARHWEMADYSSGDTGAPWAYFACPNGMFKDNGLALSSGALPKWGIQPACGAALAAVVTGSISITAAYQDRGASGPVAAFLAGPSGISDNDLVTIAGIGIVPDGTYYAKVVGYSNSAVDQYYAGFGQGGAFGLYDVNGNGVLPSGGFTTGSVTGIVLPGNLNGGAVSSPNNTQPYDWCYSYQETSTTDEGNPSQTMVSTSAATQTISSIVYGGQPVAINGGQVKVAVWGTGVAGIGNLNIYRRGGALTDMLYRLVATVVNPGNEVSVTILDNTADADLVYANISDGQFNPPPVTSTLQTPIKTTASGAITVTGSAGGSWITVTVAASVLGPVLPGTLVHIVDPAGSEDVVAESSTSTTFRAYFQLSHPSGVPIEIDAITGAYCNLVVSMQGALLCAGDPNNPHILYKSATGSPQYFPVGIDAAGAVTTIPVGTPANGIVNLCEFRGQVLTLNVSNLFETMLLAGSLFLPTKVADKGLVAQSAWCKTETEVWFLSDDGIYSWDGGSLRNRSTQIDGIFKGLNVNGIPPLVYEPASLQLVRMEFRGGLLRFGYTSFGNNLTELVCEPRFGDRWTLVQDNGTISHRSPNQGTSTFYCEPDTKSLIVAGYNSTGAVFGIQDSVVPAGFPPVNYTSDWWGPSGTPQASGVPIAWSMTLPWFDMGKPNWKKVFEEIWLDIDPQLYDGVWPLDSSLTVSLFLDYATTAAVADTFTINLASGGFMTGRQLIALLPLLSSVSGTYESFGREARAISLVISGFAYPVQTTMYGVIIQYQETGMLTAGGSTDWDNLGVKTDKRLYQMTVEFDVEGTNQTIVLDTMNGISGNTYNPAVQSFVLSNPILTGAGPGRAIKIFPVADMTIAKLVRLRTVASTQTAQALATVFFKIHSVEFDKEVYPEDIVTQTPWTNGGYEYLKYANQVALQVNTNNVPVVVQLQADNATVHTFTVTSIISDRQRNVTAPAGLAGYEWRLYVDPNQTAIVSGGGQFQLWSQSIKFQPADKGEVGHTFQWEDLGHPYDKFLKTVTIDWDLTGLTGLTLQMDTISGITGQTETPNVAQFVLGTARGKQTFALPLDTIAKMIRIYPLGAVPVGYKQWKYEFDKIDYPADIISSTGWKDAQSPVDKNPSWLWIDADTANVPASVILQNEGGTVMTVQHTGTLTDRKFNYPIPADITGKMWRLVPTIGLHGKFQSFNWGFDRWQAIPEASGADPCEVVLWTPWSDNGYPFGKTARSLILTINTGGVPCSVALQSQEGGTVQTFSVTTTYTTRRQVLTCNPNLTGTQWRLLLTPGVGGLAKLWDWNLDVIKLPPALTQWSSYSQGFSFIGFKFIKDFWADYICAGTINVTFTSDTGSITFTLPAHPVRDVERFLFPAVWGSGLNKSTLYGVLLVAANPSDPFMVFADVSGIEWTPCGADRHTAYSKSTMSEFLQVAI